MKTGIYHLNWINWLNGIDMSGLMMDCKCVACKSQ